jgi:HK97 family phage major capsid protein
MQHKSREKSLIGLVKELRGKSFERTFSFDRETVNEEDRTVWLAISSETPVQRYFGYEILDHSKNSIKTERLEKGLPILMDHNSRDQVGIVEEYEISQDRKLRLKARFGKSQRASEIYQDVLDGIRKNTSVGYEIHNVVLERIEEDENYYRVTSWSPFEGSIVSIPADLESGIGRSKEHIEEDLIMPKVNDTREEITSQPKVENVVQLSENEKESIRQKETNRINEILSLSREFEQYDVKELADSFVKDSTRSAEDFRKDILDIISKRQKEFKTVQPAEEKIQRISMNLRYKPLKAFRDMPLENGKTLKAEEAAYRAGQWLLARVYNNEKAQKFCRDNGIDYRVMSGSALSTGGAVIPVEMEQAVIDLRDTYGVARQLANVRPMTSDSLQIPRRDSGLTAYYFADDDGTGITASDKGWGQVTLNAKKLGVLARVSRDMVEDAIINVIDDLAREMAYAFAVAEDQAFIDGDGTSTYGGITGIRTKLNGTAYASLIDLTSGDDQFTEVIASDLALIMGSVAAYAKMGAVWLISETGKSLMFDRLALAAGGNTMIDVAGQPRPSYAGYPIITSQAMPTTQAAQNDQIMFMFGRFDMAASLGSRRGIEVQVLQERYAELGQLGIVATERYDIVVHDLGSTTAADYGPVAGARGNT